MKCNIIKSTREMPVFYRVLAIGLFLTMVIQIIVIGYINFTQMRYHIGFDASSYYLKAYEMWKEKSLICPNWVDQTTLYWDSAVPIAALLMNIFQDIFISYGVANFIVDIGIILLVFGICEKLNISVLGKLFAVNLVICPHLAINMNNVNNISYFSSTLTSGSWYGVKVLLSLLFVYAWLLIREKKYQKKYIFLYVITSLLYLISGISSGYYLGVTILVPMILCGVIYTFVKNDFREMISKEMLFSYINLIIIFVGKYISSNVLDFASKDSTMVWTSQGNFWQNLTSIFLGYMSMLKGLPATENIMILSATGIQYFLGLGIACITIIAFIAFVVLACRKYEIHENKIFIICILGFNIAMFSLLYTTYASEFFEERYLIIPFYFIVIGTVIWIDSLDNKLVFKNVGCFLLAGLLLLQMVRSDYQYLATKIDTESMEELAQIVSEIDSPFVCYFGEQHAVDFRNMRVYDTDKIYKALSLEETGGITYYHWGDYTYYDYANEWEGPVILCVDKGAIDTLPTELRKEFTLYKNAELVDVYISETNVLGK